MTHSPTNDEQGHAAMIPGDHATAGFAMPIVSVIIVNFNYARFLADSVSSVFAQTYKHIECYVVDNNSTDDSRRVIEELRLAYPQLRVILRPSNDGQCVASAEVFAETRGQYIVFLDADDVLMPEFVGTHLYVHLSLCRHVGFTCSDMYQVVGDELVLGTSCPRDEPGVSRARPRERALRPLSSADWPTQGLHALDDKEILFVDRGKIGWPWAATSAFMFRRDAVAVFVNNPRLKKLRGALDAYFARGINAVTGSVLIDRSLSIYRIHGANVFSRHAHLDRCFNFEPNSCFDQNDLVRRELVDFWLSNARFLIRKFLRPDDFFEGLRALSFSPPVLRDDDGALYTGRRLAGHFRLFRNVIGLPRAVVWCLRLRIPPGALLRQVFETSLKPDLD